MPVKLVGLWGVNDLNITSGRQATAHLALYSGRVLEAKDSGAPRRVIEAQVTLLYEACDVLLDARLMFDAVTAWETAHWDVDLGELERQSSSEAVAA